MNPEIQAQIFNRLPHDSHYEAMHKAREVLPPPLEETQEAYARRDRAVLNQIKQLVPVSGIEVELAGKAVSASEFGQGCLREANQLPRTEAYRKIRIQLAAQASLMGREARGYLVALERIQKLRLKREATEAGACRADAIEGYCGELLLEALLDPPPPRSKLPATDAEPPEAAPALPVLEVAPPPDNAAPPLPESSAPPDLPVESKPAPPVESGPAAQEPATAEAEPAKTEPAATEPVGREPALPRWELPPRIFASPEQPRGRCRPQDDDDDWPPPDWAAQAELYALNYPQRARLIRRLGGLPRHCDFGPPEPELVRAIVRGSTPELLALDRAERA